MAGILALLNIGYNFPCSTNLTTLFEVSYTQELYSYSQVNSYQNALMCVYTQSYFPSHSSFSHSLFLSLVISLFTLSLSSGPLLTLSLAPFSSLPPSLFLSPFLLLLPSPPLSSHSLPISQSQAKHVSSLTCMFIIHFKPQCK